jgi:hypothetical protein
MKGGALETGGTALAELLGPTGQELIREAQNAKPTLDELVRARVAEAGTITTIVDDAGQLAANIRLEQIVELRKHLQKSVVKTAAGVFHQLHRTLTGWISAWDALLEVRERSLSGAMARYEKQKEEAVERERQRLQRIADEAARRKQEELRQEAERKAKEELDAAESQRQAALIQLVGYLGLVGEKTAVEECLAMAKQRSDNLDQVKQDIAGIESALDSLGKGNTAEALSVMKFTQKAPPPPPPPPPVLESVVPAAVYVPPPAPIPSALRGTRRVPKWRIVCGHAKANIESCANCAKVAREFLVLDESAVTHKMKKLGEASGGSMERPNVVLIPGFECWWETEATLRRTP